MPLSTSQVILYAADTVDYEIALAAAASANIPISNVIGDFVTAYNDVTSGNYLVIAVGGPANNALYYNPCGWDNLSVASILTTPSYPVDSLPGANYYENAAGSDRTTTLYLATVFAYYAVNGSTPPNYTNLPAPVTPTNTCAGSISVSCPCLSSSSTNTGGNNGGVGVYAGFGTEQTAINAINMGWTGVSATGALGIKFSPYTSELISMPDRNISNALNNTSGNVFWLSFWTVSWPDSGDTFYNGGYQAGICAATTIMGYNGNYVPNYIIIDPEGYTNGGAASTNQEWADWLTGWADGIHSVNPNLNAGFYCNQSQYQTYNLSSLNLSAFIAISPILNSDGTPNTPGVSGGNIKGYIAFYAYCPADSYVSTVAGWGAMFNTVQFQDSGINCAP